MKKKRDKNESKSKNGDESERRGRQEIITWLSQRLVFSLWALWPICTVQKGGHSANRQLSNRAMSPFSRVVPRKRGRPLSPCVPADEGQQRDVLQHWLWPPHVDLRADRLWPCGHLACHFA